MAILLLYKCRAGQGVCPDVMISEGGGSQDATGVIGSVVNGLRCIEYTRPLITGIQYYIILMCVTAIPFIMYTDDVYDRSYLINNQTQFVVWAYGPRATEEGLKDLAFFHSEYPRNGGIPT